jgi:hypothetical protein
MGTSGRQAAIAEVMAPWNSEKLASEEPNLFMQRETMSLQEVGHAETKEHREETGVAPPA